MTSGKLPTFIKRRMPSCIAAAPKAATDRVRSNGSIASGRNDSSTVSVYQVMRCESTGSTANAFAHGRANVCSSCRA